MVTYGCGKCSIRSMIQRSIGWIKAKCSSRVPWPKVVAPKPMCEGILALYGPYAQLDSMVVNQCPLGPVFLVVSALIDPSILRGNNYIRETEAMTPKAVILIDSEAGSGSMVRLAQLGMASLAWSLQLAASVTWTYKKKIGPYNIRVYQIPMALVPS